MHPVQPVTAVQSEYSLWTRDPEHNGVLAGIGVIAADTKIDQESRQTHSVTHSTRPLKLPQAVVAFSDP